MNKISYSKLFDAAASAFSLIEMLMALLVASLLLAALAPVITKRINEHIVVSGTGAAIIPKVYCAYINNGTSLIKKETPEEGCIVPENTYSANIIMASGGGGGGGAIDSAAGTLDYTLMPAYTGGNGASTTGGGSIQSIKFSKASHTMWIYLTGGGAGGGGGNGEINIVPNEDNCKAIYGNDTEKFATKKGNYAVFSNTTTHPVCVTKFNQKASSGCWSEYSNPCTNYTTAIGTTGPAYEYSGCGRTVCIQSSAIKACQDLADITKMDWELPSLEVLKTWNTDKQWYALHLCDYNTNTYISECKNTYSSFTVDGKVTTGSLCTLYAPDTAANGDLQGYGLDSRYSSRWSPFATNINYPRSVRCVLSESFNRYTGGGGSSGTFIKLKVPSSILIKATENGEATLKTFAGNGGKGGNSKSISKGISGTHSYAEISDSNNNIIWRVTVSGGENGGGGANTNSAGTGGKIASSNNCKYLDITNSEYTTEKTINCSDLPDVVFNTGEDGGNGDIGTSYATTGYGARAGWGDGTLQGSRIYPPSGTSTTLIDGTNANIAGSGGSGGNCYYSSGALTCGKGGDGAGGRIYATHRISFQGAGGGGGAAGTVAHIKNVQVRPGDFFKIQIGHGGGGGNVGSKGSDGGSSYVELIRNETKISKYEILGGGGGNGAVKGDPDTNKQPSAGIAGNESKIASGTNIPNNEYYPKISDETKGSDGIVSSDFISAYGGNGGINSKISLLAQTDGTLNGKPCGGLNKNEIQINDDTKWECTSNSIVPLNLTRALNDLAVSDTTISDIIENLAPGATGGGGGGWQSGAIPEASGGAKGMGGYVIIYFGDWSQNPTE